MKSKIEKALYGYVDRVQSIESEKQQLKEQVRELDDKLAAERIARRSLEEKLENYRDYNEKCTQRIGELDEDINALKSELKTYQDVCTEQEWDIANKLAVIDFSKGKIETLEAEKAKLESDYQELRSGIIAKQQKLDAQKKRKEKDLGAGTLLETE